MVEGGARAAEEVSAPPPPLSPPPAPLPVAVVAADAVPAGPCLGQGPKKVVEMSPRIHGGTG